ncbi:MAG: hypothetical protein Athens101428_245 [Candidatus Berkelbacteria bacterium Athens1014_28]|uniref:Uncharacterized protein n=1 Tax=Candidatus Berkelbacteria bacterium Athens1014_28 TaxID=2017145 RepID=A0A554LP05_9BACT|nr:MAG: hypothetical protein Athens101428_245 [Candidatus Berkelbacteria bacterium Athens1014_28]
MKKQKTLYAITTEDVMNVADQENITFTKKDLPFIREKIGDYFGDKWQNAIEYALLALKNE